MFRFKQVVVARTDLEMSAGKLAVQVAHGSIAASERTRRERREWFEAWLREGQKKVVVKVAGEKELRYLQKKARKLGIQAEIIEDAGLTELSPGTTTVLAIGPAPTELVDKVTGDLQLL